MTRGRKVFIRMGRRAMAAAVAVLAIVALGLGAGSSALAKPLVIYFGGYMSTPADMQAWLNAARRSIPYGALFDFDAIAYPKGVSFVERDAIRASGTTIDAVALRIMAEPTRTFVVAGHSSGAGLAAAVIEKVSDRKNVHLVILDDGVDDGFTPPRGFDPATQIECWSAVNGPLESFNRDDARGFCRNYHEVQAGRCETAYCLHFSMVNQNALRDMTAKTAFALAPTGISGGYQNLRINLSWLRSSIGR